MTIKRSYLGSRKFQKGLKIYSLTVSKLGAKLFRKETKNLSKFFILFLVCLFKFNLTALTVQVCTFNYRNENI